MCQVHVSDPALNIDGIQTYTVVSPYQSSATTVEVITPTDMPAGTRYPTLYILPVTAGTRGCLREPANAPEADRIGAGILEAQKHDIANTYGVICVAPSFSTWPWIADHPTDRKYALETHLLHVVIPLIAARYPVLAEPESRLVVGFSKSGMAAFSLLLRHPHLFGYAASWDAPMTVPAPDRWCMADIYGTAENYARYFIPALLEQRAAELRGMAPRLVLLGHSMFRDEVAATHAQMTALGIPHVYSNDVAYPNHLWGAGWFPDAVRRLLRLREGSIY